MIGRLATADGKTLRPAALVFLILLCAAFFIPGFATLPPTDRDESSFAQASKQMIESGDYVDIRLQDKPRYQKPVGIYWLQTAAVRLFDPHHLNEIWAYRLPSLLGATIAVLMTALLGTLLFGPVTGLLGAMMLAGCVSLNVEARLAKTDAALLACVVIAQYALARVYMGTAGKRLSFFLFWTALAAGILIKGPVILLPVIGTLVWIWFAEKNLRWVAALKPIYGIPYALLLVVPWFAAILITSHGQFLAQSGGHDFLGKLWHGQDRGIMPPGLHLLAFPVMFFPFAMFAGLASPDAWARRHEPATRFCLGWIIPSWIVFELVLTKLPHYTLPLYPAIALLTARAMQEGFPALAKARRWQIALTVFIGTVSAVGFALFFTLLPELLNRQGQPLIAAAGLALIAAQGASVFFLTRRASASVLVMTLGGLIFLSAVFGGVLPSLHHIWLSRDIVAQAERVRPCPTLSLVSAAYHEPSLAFLAGTETKMPDDGAQAARQIKQDRCTIAVIDQKHEDAFRAAFSGTPPIEAGRIDGIGFGKHPAPRLTLYLAPREAGP